MSNSYPPVPSATTGPGTGSATSAGYPSSNDSSPTGTAEVAKDEASKLGGQAAESGKQVASVAKDEASKVASEAKTQAKDLYKEAKVQLREQAGAQQERVATGLKSLSDELSTMARNSEGSGVASDLVQQVATRAGSAASWLEQRDPGSLLDEVRNFAREKPGTFIGIAAIAGVLAGRLTRSVVSEAADAKEEAAAAATPPVAPVTPAYTSPAYTSPTGYVGDDLSDPLDERPFTAGHGSYIGEPRI